MKEYFPNSRKLSHRQECEEFWNLRVQCNREEKETKPTEYVPNRICQRRSSPEARIRHQRRKAGQEGVSGMIGPQGKTQA